jgi:DNA polymerase-1
MNIPVLMKAGFEADDVIGSMAVKAAAEGMDVYMVTPDKDYGQLISDHIWQYKPGRAGGDDEIVGVPEICARYGIERPEQVIDMLTICGDASDNVPGVKGIGEVWAGKLVSQYGTLENIYANIDKLTQKQRDMFVASRPYIDLSKKLVTIKTDVPIETGLDEMAVNLDYSPAIADLFEKYEFNSLKRYISHVSSHAAASEVKSVRLDVDETSAVQVATAVCSSGRCAFVVDTAGTGIFAPVTKVTVAALTKDGCMAAEAPASQFKAILEDPTIIKFGFDIKYQMDVLSHAGISIVGKLRDVELMHYLLDPEKAHKLDILSKWLIWRDLHQRFKR